MKTKETMSLVKKVVLVMLCIATFLLSVLDIQYLEDEVRNLWLSRIVEQCCGCVAVIWLLSLLKVQLFGTIQKWLYLIPCLLIAVNNFPFWSYFSGNMQTVRTDGLDVALFALFCLSTGLFEELVFRGILFSVLAERFSQDKRGLVKTFVFSSVIFALAHLFNLFLGADIGATLLQVGYTVLTGGLFAFTLIKTKNVLCCAFVHGLYNFCGLWMELPVRGGLGSGVVFDIGTGLTMGAIAVIIGVFVLYSLWKYPENERKTLYKRLGVRNQDATEEIRGENT